MRRLKLLVATAVVSGMFTAGFIQAQDVQAPPPLRDRATPPAVGKLAPASLARSAGGGSHLTLVTARYRAAPTSGARAEASPRAGSTNRVGIPAEPLMSVDASALGLSVFAANRPRRAPGVALMLVGAAGILTGLLLDESAITIAGAAVGGIGLYLYLR